MLDEFECGVSGTLSTKSIERDGEVIELRALSTTRARKGDRLVIETSGGCGYVDPALRSAQARFHDLDNGFVTDKECLSEEVR